jgi:hypothetical protein
MELFIQLITVASACDGVTVNEIAPDSYAGEYSMFRYMQQIHISSQVQ